MKKAHHASALLIRPRQPEDTPHIVALYNAQEHDHPSQTPERYEAENPLSDTSAHREKWVAIYKEEWAGYASFYPAWWTGDPNTYSIEIRVEEHLKRQGIGTCLFEQILSRLKVQGANRLICWLRDDIPAGLHFAKKRGFQETAQKMQDYRLFVPEVALKPFIDAEARLAQNGISLITLAEAERWGEPFLRHLHALCNPIEEGNAQESSQASFESWQKQTLRAEGVTPEAYWIALEEEIPVGVTFLKRLGAEDAENDYTGVAPTHQGRGIATALKGRAIAWAQQAGVLWFYTSSEVDNTPMIAINTRLGYRPGVVHREVEYGIRDLGRNNCSL